MFCADGCLQINIQALFLEKATYFESGIDQSKSFLNKITYEDTNKNTALYELRNEFCRIFHNSKIKAYIT